MDENKELIKKNRLLRILKREAAKKSPVVILKKKRKVPKRSIRSNPDT